MLRALYVSHKEDNETATVEPETGFEFFYQSWYTEARLVIKQLSPDRLEEFDQLYKGDGRVRKQIDSTSYTIQDWLRGARSARNYKGEKLFDELGYLLSRFHIQIQILEAAAVILDSALANIRQLVQADLFDSELDMANELARKKFLRSAGIIAGVVLEKHLHQVTLNHNLSTRKKPSINNLNQLLRTADVLEHDMWLRIQLLGKLRNLCAHDVDQKEPSQEDIADLIRGVEKVIHSVS